MAGIQILYYFVQINKQYNTKNNNNFKSIQASQH